MLENFSRSLQSIFDLYKEKRNSYFGFSLSFGTLFLFISGLLSILVCFLAQQIFKWEGSAEPFYADPACILKWPSLMAKFFIVWFGIYAIYLRKILLNSDQKPSLKGLFRTITVKNWVVILIAFSLLILIYTSLFTVSFSEASKKLPLEYGNILSSDTIKGNFFIWVDNVINLVEQYLPYFGAFVIFFADYISSLSVKNVWKYRHSIIIFILISFCINTISGNFRTYLDAYIVEFITIPIQIDFLRTIFHILTYILISPIFYLGLAASIMYPVINQYVTLEK
jgi:hypothetical protein